MPTCPTLCANLPPPAILRRISVSEKQLRAGVWHLHVAPINLIYQLCLPTKLWTDKSKGYQHTPITVSRKNAFSGLTRHQIPTSKLGTVESRNGRLSRSTKWYIQKVMASQLCTALQFPTTGGVPTCACANQPPSPLHYTVNHWNLETHICFISQKT